MFVSIKNTNLFSTIEAVNKTLSIIVNTLSSIYLIQSFNFMKKQSWLFWNSPQAIKLLIGSSSQSSF